MTTTTYPFDPTGTNPLNLVSNEQQVIVAVNYQTYHLVIPFQAPFFADGLILSFKNTNGTNRTLEEGVDYLLANEFISASRACAKPIYGAISFLDWTLAGVITMTYQTIGGAWTLDANQIATTMANEINNPRITAWEQVVNLPSAFPVINHEWDLVDMVGATEVVDAIQSVADAIVGNINGQNAYAAHLVNYNNPHQTTAAQVGLGNVANFPVADPSMATAGINNTSYMTPLLTLLAINANGAGQFASHITNYNNPHQTTASQVGLGLVQNYPVADSATAIAGVSNVTYMTPFLTAAVVNNVNATFNAHIANTSNPHNVTANQIGLGAVQNYAVAAATDAQAGVSNNLYMTPLRTSQAISYLALTPLQVHIQDNTNPHQTTALQVGLGNVDNFATATITDAQNNTLINKFMTPLATYNSIMYFVGNAFLAHINAENPHGTTKADVGLGNVQNYGIASNADAQAGTANNLYMTPATTAYAILNTGTNGLYAAHLTNFSNPHETTAAQVGLGSVQNFGIASTSDAQAGTANNLYITPLTANAAAHAVVDPHVANVSNPHSTTAAQVGLGNVQNFGVATDTQAIDPNNGTTYMTPHSTSVATAALQTAMTAVTVDRLFVAGLSTDSSNAPYGWFKLGTLSSMPTPTGGWPAGQIQNPNSDLHWYVCGGEAPGNGYGALYRLHISIQGPTNTNGNPVYMTVRPMTENSLLGDNFGYVWNQNNNTVDIYWKVPDGNNPITVVNLNRAGVTYGNGSRVVIEPVGISYITHLPQAIDSERLNGLPASSYVLMSDFQAFATDLSNQISALATALNSTS